MKKETLDFESVFKKGVHINDVVLKSECCRFLTDFFVSMEGMEKGVLREEYLNMAANNLTGIIMKAICAYNEEMDK